MRRLAVAATNRGIHEYRLRARAPHDGWRQCVPGLAWVADTDVYNIVYEAMR